MSVNNPRKKLSRPYSNDQLSNDQICLRMSFIRTELRFTQAEFADQLQISIGRLVSYENLRTPMPCDVALKICRQFIVSEKWLATSKGFFRPCVDLIAEPIFLKIDYSKPFEEVYANVLAEHFERLAQSEFYAIIRRLISNSKGDFKRLSNILLYLQAIWSQYVKNSVHAEILGHLITEAINYMEYNGFLFDPKSGVVNGGKHKGIPPR